MPLRDHFRSPVNDKHSWDGFHGMWPGMMVLQLFDMLPKGYQAAPGISLGMPFVVNASTCDEDELFTADFTTSTGREGVAVVEPLEPTLTLETDLADLDEYEVRIYDTEVGRQLVAAIEIVSPANKDRPESRQAFVAKVSALLQKGVSVSIVDLVTIRQFNLYANLLEFIGGTDPQLGPTPPEVYAVTLRTRKRPKKRSLLQAWHYPMTVGQPLPTLPIWLDVDLHVMLALEPSYQETCRLLHIN